QDGLAAQILDFPDVLLGDDMIVRVVAADDERNVELVDIENLDRVVGRAVDDLYASVGEHARQFVGARRKDEFHVKPAPGKEVLLRRGEQRQVLPAAKHHHHELGLLRVAGGGEAQQQAGEEGGHVARCHFYAPTTQAKRVATLKHGLRGD